jgi:hypothetical protein
MHSPFLPQKPKGLGDVIHAIAHPVAVAIDAATKLVGKPTNIKKCGGCKQRREDLNEAVPFKR